MIIVVFFINLVLTMFIYLFLPVTFIIIGRPITKRKMKIISAISLILGLAIMIILEDALGSSDGKYTGGALLWTFVGYGLMCLRLSVEDAPPDKKYNSHNQSNLVGDGNGMNIENIRYDLFKNILEKAEQCALEYFGEYNSISSSCVILEYYALIEYFSICVDKTTGVYAPALINSMLDELEKRSVRYCNDIDNACGNPNGTMSSQHIVRNRTANYEDLLQTSYVPSAFFLLSDYPRYENEIQDTLTRCSIAFGDFSIFFITRSRPAKLLKDIDPIIVLGIDECLYYQTIFSKLSDMAFDYFSSSLKIVSELESKNICLSEPTAVTYSSHENKIQNKIEPEKDISNTVWRTLQVISGLILIIPILLYLIYR